MPLAPTVVPPITPWSKSIKVRGQHSGAAVSIFADGQQVGSTAAAGPEIFVPLDAGVTLQPGQKITAAQEFAGETSVATAKTSAVTVLKTRASNHLPQTHAFEFSHDGISIGSPGARV